MTETGKTFAFLAAGAVAVAAAVFVGRPSQTQDVSELIGERLNQFDVEAPKSLRIVRYNPESGEVREFEVAEEQGVWSIPSKQGYPADATQQMAEASTVLMDREILRVQKDADHEALGVVDPLSANLDSKADGVGVRVIMKDAEDDALVDMIIGKQVKDTDDHYYVRKSTQDVVYEVQLDPEKLSTSFEDWIEDDLLQLNALDIQQVHIDDSSAQMGVVLTQTGFRRQVDWDRRGEATLDYDDSSAEWVVESLKKFDPAEGVMKPFQMGEDEQLNQDALRELRNGLDDLQIVDVERKPAGLGGDLKAGEEFLTNQEAVENLIERGFAPVMVDGADEIISSEGEIVCTMNNGVQYVLRFGKLQVDAEAGDSAASEAPADGEQADAASQDGINRYLFVMAQFDENAVERPERKELPPLPEGADEEQSSEQADAGEGEDDSSEGGEADDSDSTASEADAGDDANEAEQDADDADDEVNEQEQQDDDGDDKSELQNILAERKSIEQENQRLEDEYNEKITQGKEKVAELNERFGDWYYVISNDFYKQIHLGLDQLIEPKQSESEEENEAAPQADPLSGLPNLPPADLGITTDAVVDPVAQEDAADASPGDDVDATVEEVTVEDVEQVNGNDGSSPDADATNATEQAADEGVSDAPTGEREQQ